MTAGALWVELLAERQQQVVQLARDAGRGLVFYDDIAAAVKWLTDRPAATQLTRVR